MFIRVIEETFPHIQDMFNEVCDLGKEEMNTTK